MVKNATDFVPAEMLAKDGRKFGAAQFLGVRRSLIEIEFLRIPGFGGVTGTLILMITAVLVKLVQSVVVEAGVVEDERASFAAHQVHAKRGSISYRLATKRATRACLSFSMAQSQITHWETPVN